MSDCKDGSITASKLQADDLQIKLDEQASHTEAKLTKTTNNLRVFPMNIRPQRVLLWLMVIITLLNTGIFLSGIISTSVMMFANFTRIYYHPSTALTSI